uniref:RNA transcription, translation and transport factor protein n=1 Tax=Spermophilus dauricus TaxID=99837 RepID=A0A8C9Q1I8_SPEDA
MVGNLALDPKLFRTRNGDHVLLKLKTLDYHNLSSFNCKDETEFRNLIVCLEDQKIRTTRLKTGNLRNIHSSDWPKFFEKTAWHGVTCL